MLLCATFAIASTILSKPPLVNPRSGCEMVEVRAGWFRMGDDSRKDCSPLRNVRLNRFWIGKNLVTVAQFRKFAAEAGYKYEWEANKPAWGYIDAYPMVNVTWFDADAFCKWAGGRLPSEAQWEKAARGDSNSVFPWGNTFIPANACSSVDQVRTSPEPVGSRPQGASPYGCLDMSGNAAQWCSDWYSATGYVGLPAKNPEGLKNGDEKALRGGNWFFRKPEMLGCAYRGDQPLK